MESPAPLEVGVAQIVTSAGGYTVSAAGTVSLAALAASISGDADDTDPDVLAGNVDPHPDFSAASSITRRARATSSG